MHHVELSDPGNSVVSNVQASTNLAGTAVAANQILALYCLGLACFAVLYGREHRVRILNEVLEGDAESNVHFGLRVDRSLKNRLGSDLGDPHCGFDRLRAVVALTNERPRHSCSRLPTRLSPQWPSRWRS